MERGTCFNCCSKSSLTDIFTNLIWQWPDLYFFVELVFGNKSHLHMHSRVFRRHSGLFNSLIFLQFGFANTTGTLDFHFVKNNSNNFEFICSGIYYYSIFGSNLGPWNFFQGFVSNARPSSAKYASAAYLPTLTGHSQRDATGTQHAYCHTQRRFKACGSVCQSHWWLRLPGRANASLSGFSCLSSTSPALLLFRLLLPLLLSQLTTPGLTLLHYAWHAKSVHASTNAQTYR